MLGLVGMPVVLNILKVISSLYSISSGEMGKLGKQARDCLHCVYQASEQYAISTDKVRNALFIWKVVTSYCLKDYIYKEKKNFSDGLRYAHHGAPHQ